jgi:uncharacterized protein (DUF2225 family)
MKQPSKEHGCNGKIKLDRRYKKKAIKLSEKHGRVYGVYLCPHCWYYHLTTKLENRDEYESLVFETDWH